MPVEERKLRKIGKGLEGCGGKTGAEIRDNSQTALVFVLRMS